MSNITKCAHYQCGKLRKAAQEPCGEWKKDIASQAFGEDQVRMEQRQNREARFRSPWRCH